MSKAKKSQVSMFIIIGIIIIICSIAFIAFTDYDIDIFTDQKSSTKVKEFVESCLELETNRALEQIGNRGGWIYPQGGPYAPLEFEEKQILDDPLVKKAEGVDFFNVEIPYWYYYDDSSESFRNDLIPPYNDPDDPNSIQNQMERHIEENIERECFINFNVFKDVYDIEYDINEINADVELPDRESKEISVILELPIQIEEITSEGKEYIDFFSYETENVLYIPYLLARDVIVAEDNTAFLEHKIISFMKPYEATENREGLPPTYALELRYDFDSWRVADVARKTKQIITHLYLVKDINTDYEDVELPAGLEDSEFAKAVLNKIHTEDYLSQYSILLQDDKPKLFSKFKNYKLNFEYQPFHPMSFKISPSIGNVLVLPNAMDFGDLLLPIFFTEYVSAYDITTAVFVEIKSSKSDGYRFRFPIEVNIDNNNPLRNNYNLELNFSALTDTLASAPQLTCNPIQFISRPVRINITDPINYGDRESMDDPLTGVEGAIVEFTCKNLERCIVLTDTPINGQYPSKNITELEFSLPINCNPGTLRIFKFGHKSIRIEDLDPNLDDEINLGEFEMPSSKTLELNVHKKDSGTSKLVIGQGLRRDETGFLILENLEEENFVRVIEVNYENQYDLEIDLMPGNHSITGIIIDNRNRTIPAKSIKECAGVETPLGCIGREINVDLPQINLSTWVSASLERDRFEVKTSDLLQYDELTVNLINLGVPTSYDDLEDSSDASNTKSISNSNSFEPYFD